MGATATLMYGLTLLLDPVPPEKYEEDKLPAKKWGRKPWGRKKGRGKDGDSAESVKEVRPGRASSPSHSETFT